MGIEFYILISLILLVVLYDLISKGKIFKKQKGNKDITIYTSKGKESNNHLKVILALISLTLIIFLTYSAFAITLSLNDKQVKISIIPECAYYEETLKNCNSFYASIQDGYANKNTNQLLGLSYINRMGKIRTLKLDKKIIAFDQSFVRENLSENKFETEIIVFKNNSISSFLFKNFGEGFWTKKINLYYEFENFTELPSIKEVTIVKNGLRRSIPFENSTDFDHNQFNYNIGTTFENSNYIFPYVINSEKVFFEVTIEKASYDHNYSIEFYSKEDESFNDKINKIIEDQPRKKTKVKYLSDGIVVLQKEIDVTNDFKYDFNVDYFLSVYKAGKIHLKKLGEFKIDSKGPSIYTTNFMFSRDDSSESIFIDVKEWRGNRHPYEITIDGYVSKLLINGINIKIDRNKNYQKLFRELYFSVPLGYYRIPIVAYDRYGNRSETYIEGNAVIID